MTAPDPGPSSILHFSFFILHFDLHVVPLFVAAMLVLVANLGSTSFKFKLLDMELDGEEVARGGYERIGQPPYKTHGDVIDVILKDLPKKPDAIGFKAVHGGPISGAGRGTDEVLATMEQFADVALAHNPPYIAAMKAFRQKLPKIPQVAAFET